MEYKKEEVPENPDEAILSKGERFLKALREMPYDNSRVGKSFIIVNSKFVKKSGKKSKTKG